MARKRRATNAREVEHLTAQMRFRRTLPADKVARLSIRAPFHPLGSCVALVFFALVVVPMALTPDTCVALVIGPVWIVPFDIASALFYVNRPTASASASAPTQS